MTQKKYAEGTSVPIERTMAEILSVLKAHGCSSYAFAVERGVHQIMFAHGGYSYKMSVIPPDEGNFELPATRQRRTSDGIKKAYEDEYRRRARVLLISVKAKMEMCSIGSSIEKEFLGDLMLPTGRTMAQWSAEELPKLNRGEEPTFMLMLAEGKDRGKADH
jgi:hypothetical protein